MSKKRWNINLKQHSLQLTVCHLLLLISVYHLGWFNFMSKSYLKCHAPYQQLNINQIRSIHECRSK